MQTLLNNNVLTPLVVYNAGLIRTRYSGYFADNVNWFNTASVTNTSINTSPLTTGYTGDFYSIQWLGYFRPSTTETYTFYTESDDASYLWIGATAVSGFTTSNAVVNNGGLHAMQERSGTISLTAGVYYNIRIQFGENEGGDDCIVRYSTPTISKTTNMTNLIWYQP